MKTINLILISLLLLVSMSALNAQELNVTLTKEQNGVRVSMELTGADTGNTKLMMTQWGGISNLSSHFEALEVKGEQSGYLVLETTDTDGEWTLEHQPGEAISLSYLLPENEREKAGNSEHHYRPVVNDTLFHAVGHNFLMLPEHYSDMDLDLTWSGFDGQTITSLGSLKDKSNIKTRRSEVHHSLFVAGELQMAEITIKDKPVYVTLHGDGWNFEFEELARLVRIITEAERAFFNDYDYEFYWINAIAVGQPLKQGYSFGGTRLHNNFALFLNPSTIFEYDLPEVSPIIHLIAHEMMHTWIGGHLTTDSDAPEGSYYWLTEGLTNYLTSQVLYEHELMNEDQFVQTMNNVFKELFRNPAAWLSNAEIAEQFWTSGDAQRIPYLRGELVALYLEQQLGDKTDVKSMAIQWMNDKENLPMNMLKFMSSLASYLSTQESETLEQFIVAGKMPAWPEHIRFSNLCLAYDELEIAEWDSGFDHSASFKERVIVGVREGTNAHAAGLRDGQKILSGTMSYGDTSKKVELKVEGREEAIMYLPHGKKTFVPQLASSPGNCAR